MKIEIFLPEWCDLINPNGDESKWTNQQKEDYVLLKSIEKKIECVKIDFPCLPVVGMHITMLDIEDQGWHDAYGLTSKELDYLSSFEFIIDKITICPKYLQLDLILDEL